MRQGKRYFIMVCEIDSDLGAGGCFVRERRRVEWSGAEKEEKRRLGNRTGGGNAIKEA